VIQQATSLLFFFWFFLGPNRADLVKCYFFLQEYRCFFLRCLFVGTVFLSSLFNQRESIRVSKKPPAPPSLERKFFSLDCHFVEEYNSHAVSEEIKYLFYFFLPSLDVPFPFPVLTSIFLPPFSSPPPIALRLFGTPQL